MLLIEHEGPLAGSFHHAENSGLIKTNEGEMFYRYVY